MISSDSLSKTRIVCDTDVVSYLFGRHQQGKFFEPYLTNKTLAVSFMTVAQLYYGAYKAGWGNDRLLGLQNHLKNYVVLPYNYDLCLKWADIRKNCENNGFAIEQADCWIATSAMYYDCALATNNGKHFTRVEGLSIICPGFM